MKFKKVRQYDCDVEKAVEFFIEKELGYDLTNLENVTTFKRVKREDDGAIRNDVEEWCAHAQLPPALRAVIPPKALTWYQHAKWVRATKTLTFRIEPIILKGKVDCTGRTIFSSAGQGKYARDFEVEIVVKLPLIASLAENVIVDLLKKNEQQEHELVLKTIDRIKQS